MDSHLVPAHFSGNSGASFQVYFHDHVTVVHKSSDQERLIAQAIKQQEAVEKFPHPTVRIPTVLDFGCDYAASHRYWMEYAFVPELDFIAAVRGLTTEQLQHNLRDVLQFVERLQYESKKEKVPTDIFWDKLWRVKAACYEKRDGSWDDLTQHAYEQALALLCTDDQLDVPTGFCHGDLTLSNVLFAEDHVTLLDFSPVFLDSYLLDIIKLRQDACFHWTSYMYPEAHHAILPELVCRWLSRLILQRWHDTIFTQLFQGLEILNYLRILPYANTDRVRHFIHTTLEALS